MHQNSFIAYKVGVEVSNLKVINQNLFSQFFKLRTCDNFDIAVARSMKSATASPSRPLLDNTRQRNGEAQQCRPTLRSVKLT